MTAIAIVADFSAQNPTHLATDAAIGHSSAKLGLAVRTDWIHTNEVSESVLDRYSAFWIGPGSPYRDMESVLRVIRYARQNEVPCFGTCGGMQHMILEYARNVLHFEDATSAEYDPYASKLFISELTCSLRGRTMELQLAADSKVASWYAATHTEERYYCNFGVNPAYLDVLRSGPLKIVGADAEGEVRVMELPGHPFFVGVLCVPQSRSAPEAPHPLVSAFITAASKFATRMDARAAMRGGI